MNVLGIDTATAATAVCVLRADGTAHDAPPAPERLLEAPAHARELMPLVARQLEAARLGFEDLEAVAVGVGPGSYTGLRIGIASARAIAQARGLPLHPVGSLAALAAGIEGELAMPVIDARRGEVFAALYEAGRERLPPFVAEPGAAVEQVLEARREGQPAPLAAGAGALRFRPVLEAASIEVAPAGAGSHAVSALYVCRLGIGAPAREPEAIVPHYLRAPDARPRR